MNENELKLNNLFRQNGSNFVEMSTFETFELLSRGAIFIEGVPLTEEWLLKCGFKKDRNGFILSDKNSLSFSITKEGELFPCWHDRALGILPLKYVHQLQNLYFDLTGNELLSI